LVVIIFHTMMDLTLLVIFPVAVLFPFLSAPVLFMYLSMVGILAAIIAVFGPKQLVRKRSEATQTH